MELSDHSSKLKVIIFTCSSISLMENEWRMSKEISVLEKTILYLHLHTNLYIIHLQITRGPYFTSHITGHLIPLAIQLCHLHVHLRPLSFKKVIVLTLKNKALGYCHDLPGLTCVYVYNIMETSLIQDKSY